ncbi:hypothetical protein WJX74_009537 [Apatococcus lobatus]|uniref:Large ribosomal subunit protein eL24-related N-terminal domain-containing protein n=2 Tax=Apatococcus TaxID=904362 RepID=A0AAW1SQF4_9CHLO
MVLKTATCRWSGLRIYPGRGIVFVRIDGQQFLFINEKVKSLYHQRKRPAKIAWTAQYRKAHRKDQDVQIARKKRRTTTRVQARSIAGAPLELINKRRTENPDARKAGREAALREVKERMKKTRQDKASAKAADAKKTGGKATKNLPRAGPGKVGGKR